MAAGYRLRIKNGIDRGRAHGLRRHGGDAQARGHVEQALQGQAFSAGDVRERPRPRVAQDFQPIDDWRGSASLSAAAPRQTCCVASTGASPSLGARSRSRRYERPASTPRERHDSALKHVTGQALYIDDIPEPPGTLHARAGAEPGRARAPAQRSTSSTAAAAPGVVAVLSAGDIPGHNNIARSPARTSRCSRTTKVEFAGQPLAIVVARHAGRRARRRRARRDRHRARRADPRHRDGARQASPTCRRRRPSCAAIPTRR